MIDTSTNDETPVVMTARSISTMNKASLHAAVADLYRGTRSWPVWFFLAWYDILGRYRRSTLGPLWITLSVGIFIAALGGLYSFILDHDLAYYVPRLAAGYVIWLLISGILNEGCTGFYAHKSIINQRSLDFSIYIYRTVARNFIVFFHNIIVFFLIAALFRIWPGWGLVYAVFGLAVVFVNAVWVALLLALISSRYRDVPPMIASLTQLTFFVTPILWTPESLGSKAILADINFFYHFVEIVRMPLLGSFAEPLSYMVAVGFTVVGWAVTLAAFARFRNRIVYWI